MTSELWSLAVPVCGLPLKQLSVIGSGKDLEMRIVRDGWPLLVLPLDGVRATVSEDVVLEVSCVDDVSLELAYKAPELALNRLEVRWDEGRMPGVEEELEELFENAERGSGRRLELLSCVEVEFELAAGPNRAV